MLLGQRQGWHYFKRVLNFVVVLSRFLLLMLQLTPVEEQLHSSDLL